MAASTTRTIFLSAAVIALLAGGFAAVQMFSHREAGAQMPGGEMPAMPVPVVVVEEKPVQIWKEFSARLSAVDSAEIRPQVSGLIEKIHFEDGQAVKAGDLLYTIDPRPYAAAVAEARAALSAANDDYAYAKKELERAGTLAQTGALSKAMYDQRVNAEKIAKSNIASANARLKSTQVDLDRATIEAPIDGRVSRAEITVGNLVNAAEAPLLTTVVSDANIYADFEVDEQTYLRYVRQQNEETLAAEQLIPVRMNMNGDQKSYQGRIQSFDNRINPASGTIRARAVFNNDDKALLPGMYASVQIGSASEEPLITITERAVQTDQNRKYVFVVDESGTATYREVTLGDVNEGERIVLSGLAPGDRVIVDGLMKLRPGSKVQAMSPEELAAMKAAMAQGGVQQGGAAPAEATPAEAAPQQEEAVPTSPPAEQQTAEPMPEITPPSMGGETPDAPINEETGGEEAPASPMTSPAQE